MGYVQVIKNPTEHYNESTASYQISRIEFWIKAWANKANARHFCKNHLEALPQNCKKQAKSWNLAR